MTIDDDDDEEFELEEIIESRILNGELQYRVSWTGRSPDPDFYHATDFCEELVKQFHDSHPNQPSIDNTSNLPPAFNLATRVTPPVRGAPVEDSDTEDEFVVESPPSKDNAEAPKTSMIPDTRDVGDLYESLLGSLSH